MRVTYVGPADEVEVPDAGVVCKRGETVDVPDHVAGRVPAAAKKEGDEPDPGEGLLAQPDNWQPAKVTAATTPAKKD